jgi:hypothetical protein
LKQRSAPEPTAKAADDANDAHRHSANIRQRAKSINAMQHSHHRHHRHHLIVAMCLVGRDAAASTVHVFRPGWAACWLTASASERTHPTASRVPQPAWHGTGRHGTDPVWRGTGPVWHCTGPAWHWPGMAWHWAVPSHRIWCSATGTALARHGMALGCPVSPHPVFRNRHGPQPIASAPGGPLGVQ